MHSETTTKECMDETSCGGRPRTRPMKCRGWWLRLAKILRPLANDEQPCISQAGQRRNTAQNGARQPSRELGAKGSARPNPAAAAATHSSSTATQQGQEQGKAKHSQRQANTRFAAWLHGDTGCTKKLLPPMQPRASLIFAWGPRGASLRKAGTPAARCAEQAALVAVLSVVPTAHPQQLDRADDLPPSFLRPTPAKSVLLRCPRHRTPPSP